MGFSILSGRGRPLLLSLCILLSLLTLGSGCNNGGKSSETGNGGGNGGGGEKGSLTVSPQVYEQMVATFYAGILAYQTSGIVTDFAKVTEQYLVKATELVPGEPAAWANLGLFRYTQKNDSAAARQALEKALSLAPASGWGRSYIEMQLGYLESFQLKSQEAIAHFRKAIEADPKNGLAHYGLSQELLRVPDADAQKQVADAYDRFLEAQPDNFIVLQKRAELAAQARDTDTVKKMLGRIKAWYGLFPADAQQKFQQAESAANGSDAAALYAPVAQFGLLTKQTSLFKSGLGRLEAKTPLQQFILLPDPKPTPAAPDTSLTFTPQPLEKAGAAKWNLFRTFTPVPELPANIANEFKQVEPQVKPLADSGPYALLANGKTVQVVSLEGGDPDSIPLPFRKAISAPLPFPGGPRAVAPNPEGVVIVDFDYDFRPDIVLAGAGGLRFYKQLAPPDGGIGKFTDVTGTSKLPVTVTAAPLWGAWPADYESDGDLDLIVAPVKGAPYVVRNNGDGTWKVIQPFNSVPEARAFAWGDWNAHGEPDAAFADAQGKLYLFENGRGGAFQPFDAAALSGKVVALSTADPNRDGVLDLVLLESEGAIRRLSRNADNTGWETEVLTQWTSVPQDGTTRLHWADLDNNGGFDLIASGKAPSTVWLSNESGELNPLAAPLEANALTVAATSENGRLHLCGINAEGKPIQLTSKGEKSYHWQDVRPRARPGGKAGVGDSRINTFGVGGEMELRAGLLYAKQPITGPTLHYGLGENTATSAIRIIWPNGYPRSEFPDVENGQMQADQIIFAPYRLGGSCPWLFAWDGEKMAFVTDCIWRSPLGLKINAQDTAGVAQTEDWIKIRGDQLAPRDGHYELSICAELWETHFFDHLALMAVDHPVSTEIFIDERFAIPPPPLSVIATTTPKPVLRATDDNGDDVTQIVAARDNTHLDTFGRGQYQGVTRDHYVEVEIGQDAPADKPLYLLGTGWIHPTDSSINVAISQGGHEPPKGLSLEIPDGKGGWRVAKPGLGFPEGKIKTVVLDLTGLFKPGEARRVRLRTNLEIYWDFLGYATGLPETPLKKHRLDLASAELRYRGFSQPVQGDLSTPERGDYENLIGVNQSWLDLEGFYTRFGEVKPLLTKTDDHYVIMNAGDELALRFPELPPPPDGWTRDYVLIGDGWVKDGNFNTTHSRTVLPLPYHGQKDYTVPPRGLKNDPVYRRFPKDWETYHTRYVSPDRFLNAMKPPPLRTERP